MTADGAPAPFPSGPGLVSRRLLRRSGLSTPFAMRFGGYLWERGWYRTFRLERALDRDGRPIPWYTYPCIAFLQPRLTDSMRVFEFGAGMSTLWYAEHVGEVVSVEHDRGWAERMRSTAPPNCRVVHAPGAAAYVGAVRDAGRFDIVVVDGEHRAEAALAAVDALSDGGVMIWDNSDWPEFRRTVPALRKRSFKAITFAGLAPVFRRTSETTVLYREGNCLGI